MIKIIVVENEKPIVATYKETLIAHFENQVICDFIDNLEDAKKQIVSPDNDYQGAIIDLRLDSSETDNKGGNEILHLIKDNLRFPIIVLSAVPDEIDGAFFISKLFQKREKNTEEGIFKTVIEEIIEINEELKNTGIFNILSKKGHIEKLLSEIFYKHTAQTLDFWAEQAKSPNTDTEKALLRYTLAHIQEYLELAEINMFENYHSVEFYINPPIKPKVFTGDILKNESGSYFIVLTPACNLANLNRKSRVILAEIDTLDSRIKPFQKDVDRFKIQIKKLEEEIETAKSEIQANGGIEAFIDKYETHSKKTKAVEEKENYIGKLKNNAANADSHYLPNTSFFDGGFINFQKISSLDYDGNKGALDGYAKILTIANPFIKDIIARFSLYYARQGQPILNHEIVTELITNVEHKNSGDVTVSQVTAKKK